MKPTLLASMALPLASLLTMGLTVVALPARAAPETPAPAPTAATPAPAPASMPAASPPSAADASWTARYQQAKRQMLAGEFAEASRAFSLLAASAPDGGRALLAAEQAAICRTWADGGFTLVGGGSEAAEEARAAHVDRRTTGELATLYTTAVLYGIGSGIALAVGTKPGSPAGLILPSLAFAGASAGLVALVDHQTQLRYGVPQSIVSGLFIGLEEAIAWSSYNQASSDSADEWSPGQLAALYWATASAGALAGGILGTVYGTTPGRAALAGSGAFWSALIAGLATAALSPDDDRRDDHALLAASLALNIGGVAAVIAGSQVSPSIARVRFVDLGGLAGAVLFGGVYIALAGNGSHAEAAMAFTASGAAVGLGTAWVLTRNMAPDQPRRERGFLSHVMPTVAPTSQGSGVMLGLASAL